MARVALNIDLGEFPDEPEELYALATVVNIACGGHAGDERSMKHAVDLAVRHGTLIAAHPSYPDRPHFGRARMAIPLDELYESIVDQVTALARVAQAAGTGLWGAKAHGALYHAAAEDPRLAAVFLDGVTAAWPDVGVIVGPPKGHLADASRARGLAYAREGFADRGYTAEGALVQRGLEGALLTSPETCVAQALALAEGGDVETLCVHGDGPDPVGVARAVCAALTRENLLARS